jgi:hypothetical protein
VPALAQPEASKTAAYVKVRAVADKLPFYEELRVPEVWVIHRDTKKPEIYLLKKTRYRLQRTIQGWARSPLTGMELCASDSGKLIIRSVGDDSTRAELPED